MEKITNTLGGAAIMLAQAFPAAAEPYPVTIDCALGAMDVLVSLDESNFPRLPDVSVTNSVTEAIPDTVAKSTDNVYSPFFEMGDLSGPLDFKRNATITIGDNGFISSIESNVEFKLGSGSETFNAAAALSYTSAGSDLDVTTAQAAQDPENATLTEFLAKGSVERLDRLMRECAPPDLISSTRPGTAFRLG